MKRFVFVLSILFCGVAFAQTISIDWKVDGNIYSQSTCEYGGDLNVPTAPTKYGYTFQGWNKYLPVEYLDISKGSYINTKYNVNTNTSFVVKLSVLTSDNDNGIFGAGWAQQSSLVVYNTTYFKSYFASGSGLNNSKRITTNTPYVLHVGNGYIKVDDTITTGTPLNSYYENSVFMIPYFRVSGTFRFYYFQIYDNDNLVRDFIPVLDSNGVPCMYEKVEGVYYYNKGSGSFTTGPLLWQ